MALSASRLMEQAISRTGGLTDFHEDGFRTPFGVLIESLNTEANLSAIGETLFENRLVELLCNRLEMQKYISKHPEILNENIEGPVVIVGLPRTGTTLLHRILACAPDFYSLIYWECKYPSPLPGTDIDDIAARIEAGRIDVEMFLTHQPKLAAIHPIYHDAPDEEVILLDQTFCGAFDSMAHVPGFTRWLRNNEHGFAYEYLKRILQFLQWQKKRRGEDQRTWLLKAPHHLRKMEMLFSVFPHTRVIQTHRDPLQTIPSMASFCENLWSIYSDQVDPKATGAEWSEIFSLGMASTIKFREGADPSRFLDIQFQDTLTRPMEVVQTIFHYLGRPLPEGIQSRMESWLEANSRDKRPTHNYSPEHFGLSEAQLKKDFADYRKRFLPQD
ncbi:MAG: sulfotransferase [Proteobacteria bacterium]|nr:sulfotransferase [Pseudomonadota bacterium]HQR03056.1 sulfotransferase [Rhodocyclaceae bacterium]